MAEETESVKLLLGEPKKAIIHLAIPIAIATLVQSLNNLIDAAWLAGVGTAALAATGVIFPYFFIMIGIGNGIGVGASQAIARRIGAREKDVDQVAVQACAPTFVISLTLSIFFSIFMRPLLSLTGAGDYMQECIDYATPMLSCGVIIAFCSLFSGILRAEGAAKKAMMMQAIGAGLNMVLDPLFIFVLGWGVGGAAWATILSMVISLCLVGYWYFIKKDTYVRIPLKGFKFNKKIDWDILKIGIPASLEMFLMSITAMITNVIVLMVDSENGIAVFTTGWRILEMLQIPIMAIGFAVVPVCAAAYGAREFGKMKTAFTYSMKCSFLIMMVFTLLTFIAAPYMVMLFTYSGNAADLSDNMVAFLRICCLFMPFMAFGFPCVSIFQALGKGVQSLCTTLVMNVLRIPFCYIAALAFGTFTAVTFGMALSEIIGSIVIFVWASYLVRIVMREAHML